MHTPAPWYHNTTSGDQGLIYSEATGKNIAVSYDAKDAPLIAAAPKMLAALTWITRCPSIAGPAGLTAYVIADERMAEARAVVAIAGVPLAMAVKKYEVLTRDDWEVIAEALRWYSEDRADWAATEEDIDPSTASASRAAGERADEVLEKLHRGEV